MPVESYKKEELDIDTQGEQHNEVWSQAAITSASAAKDPSLRPPETLPTA